MSRSRARQPGEDAPPTAPTATAAQLIKGGASEPTAPTSPPGPAIATAPPANGQAPADGQPSERRDEIWPAETNGFAGNGAAERHSNPSGMAPRAAPLLQRPAASPNGDQRRTLHLSLGNSSPGNGATTPAEQHPGERHNPPTGEGYHAPQQTPQQQTPGERFTAPASPEMPARPAVSERGRDGAGGMGFGEARPAAYPAPVQRPDPEGAYRKEGTGSYIDRELRARVDGDIAAFLAAFDAALVEDTQESRSALRDATDRLLRVGARTRIELERLEARMPLPPRDNGGRGEAAWRHR